MADNSAKIAKLTELLQSGQIDQDMFDTNLAKLQTVNQNLRPDMPTRANSLSSVMHQIRSRGVGVQNVADEVKSATPGMSSLGGRRAVLESVGDIAESIPKPTTTSLERLNMPKGASKFGKTLKALGILGPAVGAMAMGDKAMAGDFGGAAMEGADLVTDYIPGVGQVKDAIRPEEIGNSELPEEIMKARALYNEQARRGKGQAPPEEIEGLEEPARYADMQDQISKRFNVLNKMK